MLAGGKEDRFDVSVSFEFPVDRGHFDGFGAGADDEADFHEV